ncbi:F0F1 ATP synthase subunit epsilon, partial [Neisseria sp. P0014.S004]
MCSIQVDFFSSEQNFYSGEARFVVVTTFLVELGIY